MQAGIRGPNRKVFQVYLGCTIVLEYTAPRNLELGTCSKSRNTTVAKTLQRCPVTNPLLWVRRYSILRIDGLPALDHVGYIQL